MIKTMLKHEAKLRAEAREHEAKIRDVVLKKKQQLENTTVAELSQLCDNMRIKGILARHSCASLEAAWRFSVGVLGW